MRFDNLLWHQRLVILILTFVSIFFFYIKIYEHEIQEKLNKKHIKMQGLNIHYKSNAYNEAAQYN